ncbi:MAG: TraR/DksA C4-type zinc finger protein [Candidatus Paceibacterota bacterium]|jgi:RNA polymerase-binding transcription factor DksA
MPTTKEKGRTHYSDEELVEFREIILEKLVIAHQDLDLLNEAVTGNPNGTQGTSPSFKTIDDAQDVQMKEENTRLARRQEKFIQCLEYALTRIKNKTYGICRETGKLISKERLRSVPHATLSMEAKLKSKEPVVPVYKKVV